MMIESLEEYLDTLAGYIYDDDKLVTYKWLSKELEVHVNTAKQILWEFVQRRREKSMECSFLLMGTLHDGGLRVEVVKEADLTEAKTKFNNVISEHIYSLQKTLPDIELLAISGEGDPRFSGIKCSESTERTDEELHVLRWGAFSKELQGHQKASHAEKTKSTSESVSMGTTNSEVKSAKNNAETKQNISVQKKGFNNLFAKANDKKSPPSALQKTAEVSSKGRSPKRKSQKGGLESFLGQSKSQEASIISSTDQDKIERKSPIREDKTESTKATAVQDETESTMPKDTRKDTLKSLENGKKQKKETRGKKRNRSKDTKPASKRMKRVTIQIDSSDSGSSNEEDEDMREPTPSPERRSPAKARSPSPPRVRVEGGKRKVLKVVDKTYEEDGFLVTKKVHEYVSCSEEEPELEVVEVKTATRESRPEPRGKKNTKQTSLMNFFKKS